MTNICSFVLYENHYFIPDYRQKSDQQFTEAFRNSTQQPLEYDMERYENDN